MNRAASDVRTPYDDPEPPATLAESCRAAGDVLALRRDLDSVARAARRPAPSIRFEDRPQGLPKRDLDMLAAAEMLAAALSLEVD